MNVVIKKTIIQKDKIYCSFPDIIKSKLTENKFFIVYREGNAHHPYFSDLVVLESLDKCKTWKEIHRFSLNLEENGFVWNCPRFSYIDNKLIIVCDAKNGTNERIATFKTKFIYSDDDGKTFFMKDVPFIGMLPDRIVKYKDIFICANHKIKSENNDLVQLFNWSRDGGETWYDSNILANSNRQDFCEASIVNIDDDKLVCYLRDNCWHYRPMYKSVSKDGFNWTRPLKIDKIHGHRPTAIVDGDNIVVCYRDTKRAKLSLFVSPKSDPSKVTNKLDIESEYKDSIYHFGYSGMTQIDENRYAVVYYVRGNYEKPYVKIAIVRKD